MARHTHGVLSWPPLTQFPCLLLSRQQPFGQPTELLGRIRYQLPLCPKVSGRGQSGGQGWGPSWQQQWQDRLSPTFVSSAP